MEKEKFEDIKFYTNNLKNTYKEFNDLLEDDLDVQQIADYYDNSRSITQADNLHNFHIKNNEEFYKKKFNISDDNINDDNINDDNINDDNINNKNENKIEGGKNTFFDEGELQRIVYENDKVYESDEKRYNNDYNSDYNSDNESYSESENEIDGGVFQSYDEKNYENGILRKKDKLINKEKNLYSYKYIDAKNNKEIKDEKILERIRKLRIPPKWNYVWISKDPNTEIQVIGHDDRGKKQYLYTTEHKINATNKKFGNLSLLVSLIPKLDKVLEEDSKLGDYDKNKILSTITKIILITGIRAGKEFHVTRNKSYGITSLRKKHIKFNDEKKEVILKFKGKSNIIHTHKINNEYIFNHLKNIYKLKLSNDDDDKLFLYYDKQNKEVKKINEFDLNDYLHNKIHPDIVIKDLRTYLVNYLLISSLLKNTTLKITKQSKPKLKKFIKQEIEKVAEYIQHTPSICKNSYIYPPIIEKFLNDPNYFLNKKGKTYEILKDLTN